MVYGRPVVGARPGREEAGGSTWWWRVGGLEEGAGAGEAAVGAAATREAGGEGFSASGRTTVLAAYWPAPRVAATAKEGGGARGAQQGSRWAFGRGLGVLSCKRSNGVVEQSMVRLAKLPDLHPRDA
ncbi:hypothetical protein ZWY2020_018392 [Hordeum vulgare]|nr:hypothetical protein ZWY2020_018392 [Hordeum vulgare]